jgi:uncharacterized membrane protein YfcA
LTFFDIDPNLYVVAALSIFMVSLSKSGLIAALGIVGVPLLTLVMPAREAAGMMLPLLLFMDAIGFVALRKQVSWPNLRILLPAAITGIVLGWAFYAFISEAMVRLMIGIITVIFCLDAWLPLRKALTGLPPSKPWGWFWGSLAGFTSFVSHTGGPPFQIYMLPQRLSPVLYAGTTVIFFTTVNLVKLIPYAALGQLSVSNLTLAVSLLPVAAIGMAVGIFLVKRINANLFYHIAYVFAFLLGLKLLYDGLMAFI